LTAGSRGAGIDENRVAKTYLTRFSFRAFRSATRCPGCHGGLYRRADEGVRPCGWVGPSFSVGANAHIGPVHLPPVRNSQR